MLTLISVLLGAAVAVAAQQIVESLKGSSLDWAFTIRIYVLFLSITTTFYFYYGFISFFYQRCSIFWITIPFLVGASNIAAAYVVGTTEFFWLAMTSVFAAGATSFVYTFFECMLGRLEVTLADNTKHSDALVWFRNEGIKNAVCTTVMGLVSFSLWGAPHSFPDAIGPEFWFLVFNLPIYVFMIFWSEFLFLRRIYDLTR